MDGRDHHRRARNAVQPCHREETFTSERPAYIHHVNFPTTDPERTIDWSSKVFGMK
jgi:hypothetical protein